MSRLRQAVLVLFGLDRTCAARLVSRLPDPTLEVIGREMMELEPGSISGGEIDRAILALLAQIRCDTSATRAGESERAQLLTTQECVVLSTCLGREKVDIAATLLHLFPLCVATRVLLVTPKGSRTELLQRCRSLRELPDELQDRLLRDFLGRIPPRPFPALAKRLEEAVIRPDSSATPLVANPKAART